MNFTVRNSALVKELRLLSKIVASKPSIPILHCVLVRTKEDSVALTVTDLESALHTTCAATVHQEGTTLLPVKKLLELLEQFTDTDVTFALNGSQVTVSTGGFVSRLQTQPAISFPTMPEIPTDVLTISMRSLCLLIERTEFAVPKAAQMYVLNGALLTLSGPVMALVATDGQRLSLATAARPEGSDCSFIVPLKTLDILPTLCDDSGDMTVAQTDRHLFFSINKRVFISRMLQGQFPKYDKIIPRDCDKQVKTDRQMLLAALRRLNVIADDTQAMTFSLSADTIHIHTRSQGFGEAEETLAATYSGPKLSVTANGRHVLDFLDRATEQSVTISLKSEVTPLLFTDGKDFLNVILARKQ